MHLRLLSGEPTRGKHGGAKARPSHALGRSDSGEEEVLPTPTHLAESFLESEPKEEKEELQAAISSQSHVFQQSPSFTEEEDEELGLGSETLSLPSFVAGFLKGVADRLQLKIKDVAVRIDEELKQDGPTKRQPEDKPDLVAGLLNVRDIEVHGVSGFTAGPDESPPVREGKRLVALEGLTLGLVSDPVVFANYAQFTTPRSPTMTMHSKESQTSSRASSPPAFEPAGSSSELAMTQSTIFEPPISYNREGASENILNASTISDGGQFSNADSEADYRDGHYPVESQTLDNNDLFKDNPGYLESVIDTQFDDFGDDPSVSLQRSGEGIAKIGDSFNHRSPSTRYSGRSRNTDEPVRPGGAPLPMDSLPGSRVYDSQRGSQLRGSYQSIQQGDYSNHHDPSASQMSLSRHLHRTSAPPSESGSAGSEAATPSAELSESKFFSHDEAQSLYMSAMSHGTGGSFVPNMPGAWDSFAPGQRPGGASETPTGRTVPMHDFNTTQETSDEAAISTPKLTASTDSYFDEQQYPDASISQSQSAMVDRASSPSSPVLHRTSEVKKDVIDLDKVLVWLPAARENEYTDDAPSSMSPDRTEGGLRETSARLQDSAVDESDFVSKCNTSTRHSRGMTGHRISQNTGFSEQQRTPAECRRQDVEVEVFSGTVRFDIATGWLLVKVCQRMSEMVVEAEKGQSSKQPSVDKPTPTRQTSLRLVVHNFSVKFIENVPGLSPSLQGDCAFSPLSHSEVENIILQLTISGLKANLSSNDERTNLNVEISKCRFGYAFADIISFDESLKLRESTRDITTPSHSDISLSLVKSTESAKIEVSTLPLHLALDIQHLEEVLDSVGGLSTILELGSSISSASTMKGAQRSSKNRPRGVHFDTPTPAIDRTKPSSIPWKVNSRIGGIVLDVTGETHCLKLSTTAVKVVSRFEGVGVQIDKAKLNGPLPVDHETDGPGKVTLTNIRVEFLFAPKEVDLDRLLTLITPSQDKYDDHDDIMLDTLLRQRRQGSVIRLTVAGMKTVVSNTSDLAPLSSLGQELGRLSKVAKYLPEDDRPGILVLALVRDFDAQVQVGGEIGNINGHIADAETAWISMPSLIATQVGSISVTRHSDSLDEELIGSALRAKAAEAAIQAQPPMFMARFIPDEMDPTFKIKWHHLRLEYTVPSVTALLGLGGGTGGDLAGEMANSIANLAEHSGRVTDPSIFAVKSDTSNASPKPMKLAILFRDCVLGLNPRNSPSKGLVVLSNSKFSGALHDEVSSEATLDVRKASIMIIDDVVNEGLADNLHQRISAVTRHDQVQAYIDLGFVPVSSISAATAVVKLMNLAEDGSKSLDVELRDDLLILETCADSTQTLISILNGLQPPTPPSVAVKYRTEVMPIQDMLASFTGDAFLADPTLPPDTEAEPELGLEERSQADELQNELEYVSDFDPDGQGLGESVGRSAENDDLLSSFHSQYHVSSSISELDFQDDHFAKQSAVGGTAHRWDSTHNTYGLSNDTKLQRSPLRVRVRDMHIIWNLFDGYDWQRTRDTISKAVKNVETKATERRARASRMSPTAEDEEESVIGDFLFNSIYIGIPANKDPRELHREINRDIDDLTSETGSYATTTTVTGATSRQGRPASAREKKLRLHRSKHHKMTFELRGVCADLVVFPSDSEETQSSLDVRVNDLEIYDHVPTSTWKKFATYMHEVGERESGTSMVHLEILTVRPVPELAASEIVLKVSHRQDGKSSKLSLIFSRLRFYLYASMSTKMLWTS